MPAAGSNRRRHPLARVGSLPPHPELVRAVEWWGRRPRLQLPFYCDPTVVGHCVVDPEKLAAGDERALFKLFVVLSMFQALRDVIIARQQRSLSVRTVRRAFALTSIERQCNRHTCSAFEDPGGVHRACDVYKTGNVVDCRTMPGEPCPVKHASGAFNRMADLGLLPVHAWQHTWRKGGLRDVLERTIAQTASPSDRAGRLVAHFGAIHRVGRKLATLFVSAVSTPALADGLTPWYPAVDGSDLVVVDTNVARAVDRMRGQRGRGTYEDRVRWIRVQAAAMAFSAASDQPSVYSPLVISEALYAFCSKSNRSAGSDRCSERATPCDGCARRICPFTA